MKIKLPQILGFSLILDIIILDQITKWLASEVVLRPATGEQSIGLIDWIINAPERLGQASVAILPYFNFTMVWNHGVSFGMLQNAGIWPLVIIALSISAVLASWLVKATSKLESIALGMIIGGAIGNTIDRFRFGAVVDFLDVYVGDWHYPAFNLADSAISIGVVLLLIHGIFMDKKEDKK